MKEYMMWFYALEKNIWKDRIEANRYFATLSILFAAVAGAMAGGGNTLESWFGWDTSLNSVAVLGVLIYVWGLNLAESIIAAQTAGAAVGRAAILLLAFAVVFAVGYVGAVVVLFLVAAWLVLMFVGGMASQALKGGSSGKNRYELDDGTVVERESGLLGGTDTFREVGGSRTFRESGPNSVREN